ncbi:hypothetical protein BDA99DRAFT_142615 [Phascolomyces articulosus]|uniref:Uncharacterized protein n=1 Tax=Phascolomyces articulosus TaxID=60185 RepID=A0AAD5PC12_9FUNG|nr:hypothetical protein BDA99DRAFT_142615 [Phascolomyces articulosus]
MIMIMVTKRYLYSSFIYSHSGYFIIVYHNEIIFDHKRIWKFFHIYTFFSFFLIKKYRYYELSGLV